MAESPDKPTSDDYADAPRTVGGRTARLAKPAGLEERGRLREGPDPKMLAPRADRNVTGTLRGHPSPPEAAPAEVEPQAESPDAETDGVVWDEPLNFANIFEDRPPEGSSDAASAPVPTREAVEVSSDEKVQIKGKPKAAPHEDEVEDILVQLPSGSPTDVTMLSAATTTKKKEDGRPRKTVQILVVVGAAIAGLAVWLFVRGGSRTPAPSSPTTAPSAVAPAPSSAATGRQPSASPSDHATADASAPDVAAEAPPVPSSTPAPATSNVPSPRPPPAPAPPTDKPPSPGPKPSSSLYF